MRKTITISGNDYNMKSSAYTQFKYKNDTGRKMLEDLQELTKIKELDSDTMWSKIEDLTEVILKMSYVMIEEADPSQIKSYEDFLKGIDGLYDNPEWIYDVIELAAAPFSRGLQNISPQIK